MKLILAIASCIVLAGSLSALFACEDKKSPAPSGSGAAPHNDHDDHDHASESHGGTVIALGVATVGPFSATATRDGGPIVAGKDAAVDVTISPSAGSDAKPLAVRFWIGVEDAAGSVKARAEIEDPTEPNRWHCHVEIPDPIPAEAKLWVEVETDGAEMALGSFDLNT